MTFNPKLLVTIFSKTDDSQVASCVCDGYFESHGQHVITYLGVDKSQWDRWDTDRYYVIISAYGEVNS